jgi:elongation factor Ts
MSTQLKKIDPKDVQRLRTETNAGVMDCKRALEDAGGDYDKAKALLKERGLAAVAKKSGREAKEGVIASYIHAGARKGALVEVASETDFVARSPEFQKLAQEIAMQVAAMSPRTVDELLDQAYIRDNSKTIKDLVTGLAATVGENVSVRRIQRFAIGEAEGEPAA